MNIQPKSSPEARFPARRHYCVTPGIKLFEDTWCWQLNRCNSIFPEHPFPVHIRTWQVALSSVGSSIPQGQGFSAACGRFFSGLSKLRWVGIYHLDLNSASSCCNTSFPEHPFPAHIRKNSGGHAIRRTLHFWLRN
jgi:hypothetical protein